MNTARLSEFLSDDNLLLHHSYMKNKYLKYSILKKSREELNGVMLEDIPRLKIPRQETLEAFILLSDIESHKCYFDSFEKRKQRCDNIRLYFGSEERLLYEIMELGKDTCEDFIYIYTQGTRAEIKAQKASEAFLKCRPILAIDLCEHAYFLDYAFDKERYLRAALLNLNLEKLDKSMSCT